MNQHLALEASEVLLDLGVSFPIYSLRLPWRKQPWQLRLTLRRPTLGSRIRIAREHLRMGVKAADMEAYDKEQQLAFVAQHGKAISRLVSYALVRSPLWLWCIPLVAWWLRWWIDERMLSVVFMQLIRCMGTEAFTAIIASVEQTNPMLPQTSHTTKGS